MVSCNGAARGSARGIRLVQSLIPLAIGLVSINAPPYEKGLPSPSRVSTGNPAIRVTGRQRPASQVGSASPPRHCQVEAKHADHDLSGPRERPWLIPIQAPRTRRPPSPECLREPPSRRQPDEQSQPS